MVFGRCSEILPYPALLLLIYIYFLIIISFLRFLAAGGGGRDYVPAYHGKRVPLIIQLDTDAIASPSERASKP